MQRPSTICEALASLPRWLRINNYDFQPHIFFNKERFDGQLDFRFCYELIPSISDGIEGEIWLNPFSGGARQSFLYLVEYCKNDAELIEAMLETRDWLLKNQIITPEHYPPFDAEPGAE